MRCRHRIQLFLAVLIVLTLLLFGCLSTGVQSDDQVEYLIGISQANMREPWRLILMQELQEEAARHPNVRLVFTDATQDSVKQIQDMYRLMSFGADLLIVSPCDSEILTPVVEEIHQTIPVIVMDRGVEGYGYSLFIGPDNFEIGTQAGETVAELANGDKVRVLELSGNPMVPTAAARSSGFGNVVSQHPNIEYRTMPVKDESRDASEDLVLGLWEELEEVDIIFAHNDYMAMGAYRAILELGYRQRIRIVGIDGFTGESGGLEMIRRGMIDATITCPTGGKEAIRYAMDILGQASGVPKQIILRSHRITQENLDRYQRMQERVLVDTTGMQIDVGYIQVGTESGWRVANNHSIQQAARDFGIGLVAVDANQSQERQIEAIRDFIVEGKDIIVLSPVVDSGWDEVLAEAKQAGIPVLLSDRKIRVDDDSLYMTYIGADFIEEGRRAASWMIRNVDAQMRTVNILELQGTIGASPTLERKQGFESVLQQVPQYQIIWSESGDFTTEGGEEIVQTYLREYGVNFDVIFAHNDDMALGAIRALEANGIVPGRDVKIISVDGTREALQALQEGRMNCVVECSPLLGPQLMKAITDLVSGKELPVRIITDEIVFTAENVEQEIRNRLY